MDLDSYDDDEDVFPVKIQSKLEQSEFDIALIIIAMIAAIAMSILFASRC